MTEPTTGITQEIIIHNKRERPIFALLELTGEYFEIEPNTERRVEWEGPNNGFLKIDILEDGTIFFAGADSFLIGVPRNS